jgi:hypothetical protein
MTRTLRLVFSKENGIKKSWDYPSSRNYCKLCCHRHCGDPTGVDGLKSLKKTKGTFYGKRYQKDSIFFHTEIHDDG